MTEDLIDFALRCGYCDECPSLRMAYPRTEINPEEWVCDALDSEEDCIYYDEIMEDIDKPNRLK